MSMRDCALQPQPSLLQVLAKSLAASRGPPMKDCGKRRIAQASCDFVVVSSQQVIIDYSVSAGAGGAALTAEGVQLLSQTPAGIFSFHRQKLFAGIRRRHT